MPRVVGIDPGTVSIDVCGLSGGQLVIDRSWPTADALADPAGFAAALSVHGAPDLVAGLSGYGLPAPPRRRDKRPQPAPRVPRAEGRAGRHRRAAACWYGHSPTPGSPWSCCPVSSTSTPSPSIARSIASTWAPSDKLCAAALGIYDQAHRLGAHPRDTAFVLLELGGAFTAAIAVQHGQVVDGIGGSSGPIGWQAAGALDGEVAYLAGTVDKAMLFQGGVTTVAASDRHAAGAGFDAFIEGAVKAVRQLLVSAPLASEVLVSGRIASDPAVRDRLSAALGDLGPVRHLTGFASHGKQGAQGAALLADGLAGGQHRELVETMRIREASGTALDHLYVVTPDAARHALDLA